MTDKVSRYLTKTGPSNGDPDFDKLDKLMQKFSDEAPRVPRGQVGAGDAPVLLSGVRGQTSDRPGWCAPPSKTTEVDFRYDSC